LRWARGTGSLDANDKTQFDTTELFKSEKFPELKKLLKLVRLPLIPAETLFKYIYPGRLVEMEDLFLATAFQAAPDCFKTLNYINDPIY
jgi:hypothetical protein